MVITVGFHSSILIQRKNTGFFSLGYLPAKTHIDHLVKRMEEIAIGNQTMARLLMMGTMWASTTGTAVLGAAIASVSTFRPGHWRSPDTLFESLLRRGSRHFDIRASVEVTAANLGTFDQLNGVLAKLTLATERSPLTAILQALELSDGLKVDAMVGWLTSKSATLADRKGGALLEELRRDGTDPKAKALVDGMTKNTMFADLTGSDLGDLLQNAPSFVYEYSDGYFLQNSVMPYTQNCTQAILSLLPEHVDITRIFGHCLPTNLYSKGSPTGVHAIEPDVRSHPDPAAHRHLLKQERPLTSTIPRAALDMIAIAILGYVYLICQGGRLAYQQLGHGRSRRNNNTRRFRRNSKIRKRTSRASNGRKKTARAGGAASRPCSRTPTRDCRARYAAHS